MSRKCQKPSPESDIDSTASESRSLLRPLSRERRLGGSKAARLRAIQELVESDSYDIPAMLVAERMVEGAVPEDPDQKG
ncbi:MAG: hypothetical protein V1912_12505 [bacterium]